MNNPMKTLLTLLILLACQVMNGQDKIYTMRYDSITPLQKETQVILTTEGLIEYWHEYEKECYADSSSVSKWEMECTHDGRYSSVDTSYSFHNVYRSLWDDPPDPDVHYLNCKFIKEVKVWIHPKQPNFEGFMQFIEKQIKP